MICTVEFVLLHPLIHAPQYSIIKTTTMASCQPALTHNSTPYTCPQLPLLPAYFSRTWISACVSILIAFFCFWFYDIRYIVELHIEFWELKLPSWAWSDNMLVVVGWWGFKCRFASMLVHRSTCWALLWNICYGGKVSWLAKSPEQIYGNVA